MTRKTLLIGAGFTKNFGGYLANEIYLKIFNHSNLSRRLKNHLWKYANNSDFESFYEDVVYTKNENLFSKDERQTVKEILADVFEKLDNKIESAMILPQKFSYLGVIKFIVSNFSYANGGVGYIFSLNQDLLLERLFTDFLRQKEFHKPGGWDEFNGVLLPLLGPVNTPFHKYHPTDKMGNSHADFDEMPPEIVEKWFNVNEITYETSDRRIPCLVKLHGSYYWREGEMKEPVWVMGTKSKTPIIKRSALFHYYFKTFKRKVIEEGDEDLEIYIIGYSFSDPHINKVIARACKKGAKLVVVDIKSLNAWLDFIKPKFDFTFIGKVKGFTEDDYGFKEEWLKRYHSENFESLFPLTSDENIFKFDGNYENSLRELNKYSSDI